MVIRLTALTQLSQLPLVPQRSVVALGMFDGVHRGHQHLLAATVDRAQALAAAPAVLTFANHPKPVVQANSVTGTPSTAPSAIRLLTPATEKAEILATLGFEWVIIPPFDTTLQQMSADDFEQTLLAKGLRASEVLVGADFRYGAGREGTTRRLTEAGKRLGFTVTVVPLLADNGSLESAVETGEPTKLGSRKIREALMAGQLATANDWLGRPYTLTGPVVAGEQRGGSLLGTPTANMALPVDKLVPKAGVYAGRAVLNGATYPAIANMGLNPTFAELTTPRVEVHLLAYTGPEFYGETLTFECHHFLRPEQRFETVAALKHQIALDCQSAKALMTGQ